MIRAKVLQDNQRLADGVVGDLYSSGSGLFTYEKFVGAQLPKAEHTGGLALVAADGAEALGQNAAISAAVLNGNRLAGIYGQLLGAHIGVAIGDPFLLINTVFLRIHHRRTEVVLLIMRIHIGFPIHQVHDGVNVILLFLRQALHQVLDIVNLAGRHVFEDRVYVAVPLRLIG